MHWTERKGGLGKVAIDMDHQASHIMLRRTSVCTDPMVLLKEQWRKGVLLQSTNGIGEGEGKH